MNDRLSSLRRILKVQDQVKRIADWRVADAERHKAEIEQAQEVLGAYIDGQGVDGALAAAAVDQARRLARRGRLAVEALAVEAEAAREAQGRQKLVARFVETLAREDERARDRKDLERLIEAFTSRAASPDQDGGHG